MKCQSCGTEAVVWRDAVVTEETGPEATITLTRKSKHGVVQKSLCEDCALPLLRAGWQGATCDLSHKTTTEPKPIKPIVTQPLPIRCIGCRLHTPIEYGGEGIRCFQKNGECPDYVIQWALPHGRTEFKDDEELLEALRL